MNPASTLFEQVRLELDKAVVGKDDVKAVIFAAVLARGNVLLEGVPGIAKTLTARAMARVLGFSFSRVQFTPDLMPSDITGTSIYHQGKGVFEFVPGPIFSDFVLADEINRAPAKTQAALLEAMEERQVTVDNRTFTLPPSFMVFATQNPLDFEGTYSLPEAQMDRFMVRITVDYPTEDEEMSILSGIQTLPSGLLESLTPLQDCAQALDAAREFINSVVVDEKVMVYVRDLIRASRSLDELLLGNSPRAGQMLIRIAKAYAAVTGSDFVTPDHVRELVPSVLPHRWVLRPEAEMRQDPINSIVTSLFDCVKVPV
ncbi:MAG: AAA family ATPase [Chitinispirillaceae bacterium]